jgi:Clp amino terminal domain, pathogenicity island component
MFERFTDRSRRVIVLAQEEARLLRHNYIGTEHLLLGMLADGEGDAARTLESVGVTLDAARREVRDILGEGHEPQKGHIPFTPRAKKVLELALREALTLRSQSIGSVHLLLGLISEGHGVGAQVIERLGASLTTVKERAAEFAGNEPDSAPGAGAAEAFAAGAGAASWRTTRLRIEGLGAVQDTLAIIERRLSRIERHLGIAPDPADRDKPARTRDPASAGAPAVTNEPAAPAATNEPAAPAGADAPPGVAAAGDPSVAGPRADLPAAPPAAGDPSVADLPAAPPAAPEEPASGGK